RLGDLLPDQVHPGEARGVVSVLVVLAEPSLNEVRGGEVDVGAPTTDPQDVGAGAVGEVLPDAVAGSLATTLLCHVGEDGVGEGLCEVHPGLLERAHSS